MSQTSSATPFSIGPDQVQSAIQFNKGLGLSARSIRVIQHVLCVEITGEFDEGTIQGLNQRDYNEVFIKNFIRRKFQESGRSAPTTWESVVSTLASSAHSGVLSELKNELGKLNEEVFWWIASSLKDQGAFNIAIDLTADYIGQQVAEKAWFFRYKDDLDHSYLTQIAGAEVVVTSDHDSQRINGLFRVSQTVPHTECMVFIGPQAFQSFDTLKTALLNSVAVEFASIVAPSTPNRSVSASAVEKNSIHFAHPTFVKAVQITIGAPVSGKMDETTVKFIAQFQASSGLGVDGVIGKGQSLPKMIQHLEQKGLQETAVLLIMGYFNMWVDENTAIYFYPREQNAKVVVSRNIQDADIIAIGRNAFRGGVNSSVIDSYAKILYPAACPLGEFKTDRFRNKKAMVHRQFHADLERVAGYATKHNLFLHINSAFRADDAAISGAVVTPAQRSNHKAGFAIDYNFVLGENGSLIHSSKLKNSESSWPASIRDFITDIRQDPTLRWGGDFNTPDVVHIDVRVNADAVRYSALRYGAQTAYKLYVKNGVRAIDFNMEEPACDH